MNQIANFEYVNKVRLEKGEKKVVTISLFDNGYEVFTSVYTASKPTLLHKFSQEQNGNKIEELTKQYIQRGYRVVSYGKAEVG